jgi:hypothetical protein
MGKSTLCWLVVFRPTPLKNDGLRQLGWLFPIYGKNMFQTTNQYVFSDSISEESSFLLFGC